jgi:hypothetical protein
MELKGNIGLAMKTPECGAHAPERGVPVQKFLVRSHPLLLRSVTVLHVSTGFLKESYKK